MKHLLKLRPLEELRLAGPKIGEQAALQLSAELPDCTVYNCCAVWAIVAEADSAYRN